MSPTEDQITGWFAQQRQLPPEAYPIGIGDDMAQIALPHGASVLVTTDMLLDGTHFDLRTATLHQVGYKSMAASLSDCAAMATIPLAAVAAVGLPGDFGERRMKELHEGILSAADKYDCPLVGGDITSWQNDGPFVICVSMLSRPGHSPPVRRNGARVGDAICVTGSLGGSLRGRHLSFEPRVREALKMTSLVTLNAMMDLSDGLSSDLNRICHQSGVGALVEAASIPISQDAKLEADPLYAAINEGEDFELLFTLGEEQWRKLRDAWDEPVPITRIGTVAEAPGMRIRAQSGQISGLEPHGYEHLQRRT